jgi:hypothetical protein
MSTVRGREMTPDEQHAFANGLRDALGLCPLYGPDRPSLGLESHADPFHHSGAIDWFAPAAVDDGESREEWRSRHVIIASKWKAHRT